MLGLCWVAQSAAGIDELTGLRRGRYLADEELYRCDRSSKGRQLCQREQRDEKLVNCRLFMLMFD